MPKNTMLFLRIGAVFTLLGIALGAFGAHALEEILAKADKTDVWRTAVLYHMVHGVALVVLASLSAKFVFSRWVGWLWVAGILCFSGSLYGLSLGGPGILGPITPLGGLCFMAGWGLLLTAKEAGAR